MGRSGWAGLPDREGRLDDFFVCHFVDANHFTHCKAIRDRACDQFMIDDNIFHRDSMYQLSMELGVSKSFFHSLADGNAPLCKFSCTQQELHRIVTERIQPRIQVSQVIGIQLSLNNTR